MLTILFALVGGTAAVAATGGQIPFVSEAYVHSGSVNDDGYSNHGQDVSEVARDKDAVGTKTNPNGKVIENHGQAVREAAHDKEKNKRDNVSADDASTDSQDDVSADGDAGGPPPHSNAVGNGQGSGSGSGHENAGVAGGGGHGNQKD